MSKFEKMLSKMSNNPNGWTIKDLKSIALKLGMLVREGKGSHVIFSHEKTVTALSVPSKRPIKAIYIKQFLDLVSEVMEVSDE